MFSKEKIRTTFLRLAGVSLGVLLVVVGGTLGAGLSPRGQPAGMVRAATPAPDGMCPAVREAFENLFATPYHLYSSSGGKADKGEVISAGGRLYVLYNGKWQPGQMTLEEMQRREQETMKNAKNVSCQAVRDETVNGESATLYSVHEETARSKNDCQIWISKRSGHVLRTEIDMHLNQGNSLSHISSRYDYNNVQAPKL